MGKYSSLFGGTQIDDHSDELKAEASATHQARDQANLSAEQNINSLNDIAQGTKNNIENQVDQNNISIKRQIARNNLARGIAGTNLAKQIAGEGDMQAFQGRRSADRMIRDRISNAQQTKTNFITGIKDMDLRADADTVNLNSALRSSIQAPELESPIKNAVAGWENQDLRRVRNTQVDQQIASIRAMAQQSIARGTQYQHDRDSASYKAQRLGQSLARAYSTGSMTSRPYNP